MVYRFLAFDDKRASSVRLRRGQNTTEKEKLRYRQLRNHGSL